MALRTFVAIELPDEMRERVIAAGKSYVDADPTWSGEKWVAQDNLHITLRFIGSLEESDVPTLVSALEGAATRSGPFTLRMSAVRAVPSLERARMLWAEADGDVKSCARLASGVDDALGSWVEEHERRPFKPHVTMARARRPRPAHSRALDAANSALTSGDVAGEGAVSVRWATLFSSTLGAGGPTYHTLARIPIGAD